MCALCVGPVQARPTKCCGRRSMYGKTCSLYIYVLVYHRAYNTYNKHLLHYGHRLLQQQQQYEYSTQQYHINITLCTEHFSCSIFGTMYHCCNNCCCHCYCSHILFERSEFLIATSRKKMCVCATKKSLRVPGISRQKSHHVRSIAW